MPMQAAQLSYLVDLGMRPDADDDAAEAFSRNLSDVERFEFERIEREGQELPIGGDGGSDSDSDTGTGTGNAAGGATGDQITRSAGGDQTGDQPPVTGGQATGSGLPGLDDQIRRELDRREQDRRRRAEFIRSQSGDDVPADLVTRALAEDWDETRVSTEFLRAIRTRPAAASGGHGHVGIHSRSHERDATLEALQGGMLLRQGVELDDQMFARREAAAMLRREGVGGGWLHSLAIQRSANQTTQQGDSDRFERARDMAHRFAQMSMVDFAREALRLSGRSVPDNREDMIHRAMSTASLTAIFSTSINMRILQRYLGIEDSTRGWCMEADVLNFMKQERGRMTKASGMKKLARGDEAQQIQYGDAIEEYKISRYAGQFTVDDQDFIDDTFGGLSTHTPEELGELAAEIRPNLVYSILLANGNMRDGNALFDASNHFNLITGSALGVATLDAARSAMASQRENGRQVQTRMRYLIVPEKLGFTADQLVASAELRNSSGYIGTSNPHQGRFQVRTDPRLDNGVVDPNTGTPHAGSLTTWYGATEGGRGGIEVGYLRGTGRAPSMETFMLTGARWGMGWKCKLDIGAKAIDWRGLLRATA